MWEYAKRLELLDKLLENSELTDEDVKELAEKIKREIAERHMKVVVNAKIMRKGKS